jgi:hypothetical protein
VSEFQTGYTVIQAASALGVSERTARRWLRGVIPVAKRWPSGSHIYDLAQLVEVANQHQRELSGWRDRSETHTGVEKLEARIQELEAQLGVLEAYRSETSPILTRLMRRTHIVPVTHTGYANQFETSYVTVTGDNTLPGTIRGKSRWVAEHGGPVFATVRDWFETRYWRTREDAVSGVRRHRGWEDWEPH